MSVNSIIKHILLTAVSAIGIWFIFKLILVPKYPLLIQLGSDRPLSGFIGIDTITPWGHSKKEISPEQITQITPMKGQIRDIMVTIEPLGQSNPKGRGSEIWLFEIASDLEKIDSKNLSSIPLPSPWRYDTSGAVLFVGGERTSMNISLKASSFVTLRLLRHPWSGQARIIVNGVSEVVDLYASGINEGQFQKKILLPLPIEVTQQIESSLPYTTKNFQLTLTGPRILRLKYAQWQGPTLWKWSPGKAIIHGSGIEVLDQNDDGLLLRIKEPEGSILFKGIQAKPFFVPNKEDFILIVFLWLVFIIFILLRAIEAYEPRHRFGIFLRSQTHWAKYALPCIAVWLVYWLAFFPALMSPDSLDQWGQRLNHNFSDHHPAFHTFIIWLITFLWLSPASAALGQLLVMSSLIGWGLSKFQRLGVPSVVLWMVCGLFAVSPVMGMMTISLWKDIFYAISVLWLTLLLVEVIVSDGKWFTVSWRNVILLGIVLFFIAIFRHNGPQLFLEYCLF